MWGDRFADIHGIFEFQFERRAADAEIVGFAVDFGRGDVRVAECLPDLSLLQKYN
jgi:hypothetical protein